VKKNTYVALIWSAIVLIGAGNALAEILPDLYTATVPVADQSSSSLSTAAKAAMSEVVVKVSGSASALRNPSISAAIGDARSHVQEYAYVKGKPPAAPLSLRFVFDGTYITDLVTQSGAPLWTANRPVVLAWVVVQDEQGRHFVNQESAPEESKWLVEEFARRGVPVQIPVFDLVDAAAVSTEDVWALNANAIQSASARYNVQDVVAGRLAISSDGKSLGDWSYFRQGDQINRSVTVADLPAFLRSGGDIVATDMASRYAVAPTGGTEGGLRLTVTGISSYADYSSIVNWLEKLELVELVNLEQVIGERVEFRLQAKTDISQMAAIIELNDRLLPMPVLGDSSQLNYQWRK
jgi:uncharacterized protein